MADVENTSSGEDFESDGIPTAKYDGMTVGPGGQIGPYKLLRILGEGGYGIVYLAEQQRPVKRRVALKVIKPGMDTKQVIARFEAERQALALLDHPNIAHVFNAGTTEAGRPYFAMEYVKGVPITEHCDRYKLTIEERLKLFLSVCEAVQHAHQKAIIHRDIKPSNILVAYEGEQAVPMIIDFGVAKALTQSLTERTLVTEQAQMIGTPEYMSPEQAEMTSQDIDTRTDIYSLGALLYELLTGTLPFDPKTLREGGPDQMRRLIREQDPQTPSARLSTIENEKSLTLAQHRRTDIRTWGHRLHGELDWITLKAMDKDRTHRYQTAHALAEDIQRYLNQEPVLAGPPSTVYKLRKFAARNRSLATSVAVIAATLVLATIVSISQMIRANRAATVANKAERAAQVARQEEEKQRRRAELEELAARRRAYASDMSLAAQALASDNLGRVRDLLDRQRPQRNNTNSPGIQDLRGWEWRYLWQESRSEAIYELCRLPSTITSLSVSPDGNWLAVGQWSHGVAIWNLRTREQLMAPSAEGRHGRVAFSPREPLLAFTTVPSNTIRLYDLTTQQIVHELPLEGACYGLAFSADGTTLVGTAMGHLTVWNVEDGKQVGAHAIAYGSNAHTRSLVVDQRHDMAIYGEAESYISSVDLKTGRRRWQVKGANELLMALALSGDGEVLASCEGFEDSTIRLWDAASGKELGRLEGHQGWIGDVLFLPDNQTLVSASADQTVRLWDVSDPNQGRLLHTFRGHTAEAWRLAMLPDGRTLVSGAKDGSINVWDLEKPRLEGGPLTLANIATYRFSPAGQSVLTLDLDGNICQHQGTGFRDKELLFRIYSRDHPLMALISPNHQVLAAGTLDGSVDVWDLTSRSMRRRLRCPPETQPVAFLDGNRQLVTINRNEDSHDVWDLTTGRHLSSWPGAARLAAASVPVFTADERLVLSVCAPGAPSILRDMKSGLESRLELDIDRVACGAFSPDGTLLAIPSAQGYVKLWETKPLKEVHTFREIFWGAHAVAFSPDGLRLVASSSGKECIRIWDVVSRQELLTLPGEGSLYFQTVFSPDGDSLGTWSSRSRLLHLWQAPSWEEIKAAERVSSE